MRFSILSLIALLTLSGCAEKGAFDLFKMDDAHERSVEQLRTGGIVLSLETKALISALYLNPVYPETYHEGESFIAAIYFENDNRSVKKRDFADIGYSLTLNGAQPVEIEELKENDLRRNLIPVRNNWNRYYLVRYKTFSEGNLALRLENNQTGKVVLNYQKGK
ncbi:MAG TPA: hypothetical protein VFX68_00445 [Sulfuricurvum sp.]|nr:hypothetical protein [Sulfuricurvum sp.]